MITVENLCITQGKFSLDNISFTVPAGEYAVLMGRTGMGKTTILEALCGLRLPNSGRILLAGRDITREKPAARGIGYVPQDGAIFTTMTVRRNLSFALELRKWSRVQIQARIEELAKMLGIEHILDRRAHNLSGGENQRIALGRALAFSPQVLALDEPLSALDEETRADMIALLHRIHSETGVTVLNISHSREDARKLATQLLILKDGKILTGSPADLDE